MADETLKRRIIRQSKASETDIALFVANLDRFLDKNLRGILADILDGKTRGVESAKVLGSLIQELDRRGLAEQVKTLRAAFANQLEFIIDEFAEQKVSAAFADSDRVIVNALIENNIRLVANEIERYGLDVQAKVMQSVLTTKKVTFDELSDKITPKLKANLKTELNTAIMTFNRTVTVSKSQELGFDLFLYIGPDDKITRPFCHEVLSKSPPIYTIDEIDGMDNGQGLPVFSAGGGYNCRHHWRPVSEERAKELGYRV